MPSSPKRPRRSRNYQLFSCYIEPADLAALREMSERTGVPVATFVRRAVALTVADNARAAKALEVPSSTP